jgi:hypothetical protein
VINKPKKPKSTGAVNNAKKPTKGERRAKRFKKARPELAAQIGDTITVEEAVKLGGYEDSAAMGAALDATIDATKKRQKKKNLTKLSAKAAKMSVKLGTSQVKA